MELTPPDPRIGQVLQGRYRILARVAAGAMGVVYRGERVELARPVAVKFLHPWIAAQQAFRTRFETEARAMSRLTHPNCVSVIDFGFEGSPYVVMDFIAGSTLRQLLGHGPLSPPRAVAISRQLLAGVAHAHAQHIIHRDLKPENFILGDTAGLADHVRILDFGLAKLRDGPAMTSGLAIGTPSYMSPEQTGAPGAIDGRTDIYAIGVVLFEMLAGRKPFVSDKVAEILVMHRDAPPPSLRQLVPAAQISSQLEAVVHRALAKTPETRFQNAGEFDQALEQVPEAALARSGGPFALAWGVDPLPPAVVAAGGRGAVIGDGDRTIADPSPSHLVLEPPLLGPPAAGAVATGGESARNQEAGAKSLSAIGALGLSGSRWLGLAAVALVALALVSVGLWRRPTRWTPRPPGVAIGTGGATGAIRAERAADKSTPAGAPVVAEAPALADRLANARALTDAGEWEQALVVLHKARRENPDSGEAAYELANLSLEHKRWADGAQAARAAAERDARYKSDDRLVKNLIASLASDKGYEKSEDVLHGFGAGAIPALKAAAAHDKSPTIRQRAAEVLRSRDAGGKTFTRPPPVARKAPSSRSFFSR